MPVGRRRAKLGQTTLNCTIVALRPQYLISLNHASRRIRISVDHLAGPFVLTIAAKTIHPHHTRLLY